MSKFDNYEFYNILLAVFLCFLILTADYWAETIASFLSSIFS